MSLIKREIEELQEEQKQNEFTSYEDVSCDEIPNEEYEALMAAQEKFNQEAEYAEWELADAVEEPTRFAEDYGTGYC